MKAAWLVARWEYLTRIRSKFFLVSTILMPLIIVVAIYLPVLLLDEDEIRGLTLSIVDESGEWERQIGELLDEHHRTADGESRYRRYSLLSRGQFQQRAEAAALLDAGVIDAYLVIEPQFGETGKVSYIARDRGRIFEQEQLRRAVQNIWTRATFQRYQVDAELVETLKRDIAWTNYFAQGKELSASDEMQAFLTPFIYAMILFFAIFVSSQILMRSIITERGNRVVEMLLSSITSRDLMTGKILGLGLVGLTQIAAYLLVMTIAGVGRGVDVISVGGAGYFLLYAIPGYFFYAAIYASVGCLFETEQEAQQLMAVLTLIPILPVVFATYVVTHPDALAVQVASFIPPLTPFLMIIRLAVVAVPWWEVVGTTLVLVVFTILMMHWTGIIFRTAILLYGKRVTLPEIVRWVKAR
ncbi:MAG: ABC transporter permease [Candidatus Neomarinimicrobiota bacterium]